MCRREPHAPRRQGNIILTDQHYEIMSVLRTHKHDSTAAAAMVVGERYPVDGASTIRRFDVEQLRANLESGVASGDPALKQHLSATTGAARPRPPPSFRTSDT